MHFRSLSVVAVLAALLGLAAVGALAQGGPSPPEATPGAPGPELAAVDPAAPGYRQRMVETIFPPGSYVTMHSHPTAIIVCVQSGALGFAIQEDAATVSRAGGTDAPKSPEPLGLNAEVV